MIPHLSKLRTLALDNGGDIILVNVGIEMIGDRDNVCHGLVSTINEVYIWGKLCHSQYIQKIRAFVSDRFIVAEGRVECRDKFINWSIHMREMSKESLVRRDARTGVLLRILISNLVQEKFLLGAKKTHHELNIEGGFAEVASRRNIT